MKKRCTLLRHESCLQSWSGDEQKNHAHFMRTRDDTHTLALLPHVFYCYLSGLPKEMFENDWGFVFDRTLWKLNSSAIILKRFFIDIENSLFHRGDLNNNNNIGFPFFGGNKEILELDVAILDSSSTHPILSHLVQYFLVSSSRKSNIV